jgi:hypothetical protein
MVEAPKHQELLHQIKEGMDVYDSAGNEFGEVEYIHYGVDDETYATITEDPHSRPTWFDDFVEAFAGRDDTPDELRDRLMRHGFIRVDADNLFGPDRYVISHQISHVSGDDVHLNVTRDELLRE